MKALRILATAAVAALWPMTLAAQVDYGGRAPNALVIDVNTGQILVDRNADIPLPPASMSKLVTLTLLFEALRDGRVQMDTTWTVSRRAHAMGGSRMFLELRDRPTTLDLIRGIAILSGNDASVVAAEGLAGTEEAFAQVATERMRQIGLTHTTIANSSGWPDPRHRMSLRDLATLTLYMLREFPEYYTYLGESEFTWNNITQPNRVPLLGAGVGLDGLKTGHTNEAGFALTGSAVQGSRRVVFVFSGLEDAPQRTREAEQIINWSFRQFTERTVFQAGQTVAEAPVWMGAAESVPLVVDRSVTLLVPVVPVGEITARAEFDGPLAAPVADGQPVGTLVVSVPGQADIRVPLLAGAEVAAGGLGVRLRGAALVLGDRLGLVSP